MRLGSKYLGFDFKSPVVPSASPLTRDIDTVKELEDAGAPAIVMHSLFEEEINHEDDEIEHYLSHGTESFAESLTYVPNHHALIQGPEEYLNQISKIKKTVDIPVIASLNGVSVGGWIEKAKQIQEAGADALELNVYYMPTDTSETGTETKEKTLAILRAVKEQISIPLALKMSHYFSALPSFAKTLAENGADALVLFNRFYQPDIDLETLEVVSRLRLSTSDEISLPLRWIAVLKNKIDADLAASTGVHTAEDVLKLTMAGANVTMTTASLLKYGPNHLKDIQEDLIRWMDEHEYESLAQMRGSMSMENIPNPSTFMRANYIKMLNEYKHLNSGSKG